MEYRVYTVLLYISVLCLAQPSSAADGLGLEAIMGKLETMQTSLQNIEQNMKLRDGCGQDRRLDTLERALTELQRDVEEREDALERKLIELENNMTAKAYTLQEVQLSIKEVKRILKVKDEFQQDKFTSLEKTVQTNDSTLQEVLQMNRDQQDEWMNKPIEKINEFAMKIEPRDNAQHITLKEIQAIAEQINNTQIAFIKNETNIALHPLRPATTADIILPYRSCREVPTKPGKYQIKLPNSGQIIQVYCEHEAFGGGWTVFQYRFNGKIDFFRNWSEYREGFGDLDGEFWLGLEYLHELTSVRRNELIIELRDYEGNHGFAYYDQFSIRSESDKYSIALGEYNGTVGDTMVLHKDMKFSTKDSDNDLTDKYHCAEVMRGAWWYLDCSEANFNGPYANVTVDWKSLNWHYLKTDRRSMAFIRMMFREVV